jgi:hypothetical protein
MSIERLNSGENGTGDVRALRELGERSLENIEHRAEIELIGISGDMTDTEELFLLNVRDVALNLHASGVLTVEGVPLWLLHRNNYLRGFTPLDMCVAGEAELAVEAGKCFANTERDFGTGISDLEERLDRAVVYLDGS